MAYKSQPRSRIYKFYLSDIWGNFFKRLRPFHGIDVFFARMSKRKTLRKIEVNPAKLRRRPQSLNGKRFLLKQKIKKFYFNLKEYQMRRLVRNGLKKRGANAQTFPAYFSDLFESRLDAILFRTNLFPSPHFLRFFIRRGFALVNGNVVKSPHYRCKIGDQISFSDLYFSLLKNKYKQNIRIFRKERVKRKKILFPHASYLLSPYSYVSIRPKKFSFTYLGVNSGQTLVTFPFNWQHLIAYYKMLK